MKFVDNLKLNVSKKDVFTTKFGEFKLRAFILILVLPPTLPSGREVSESSRIPHLFILYEAVYCQPKPPRMRRRSEEDQIIVMTNVGRVGWTREAVIRSQCQSRVYSPFIMTLGNGPGFSSNNWAA